ncbi:MAG: hypothetical protein ACYDCP_09930 [Thermoplasmataceae archaeon]
MAGTPELVLPVRMDLDKALRQLQKIADQGKATGKEVKKGFQEADAGAQDYGRTLVDIAKAQIGLSLAKQAAAAIGTEYARSAGYVADMAKQFAELRQAMQQVAALKGLPNNNEFALGEVQKAAKASLTPEAWRTFQEQFQSYGGAYLEGDQSRFKGERGMTGDEQAEKYQLDIAKFAQAKLGPGGAAQAAELAGGLLQFAKGPTNVSDIEQQFAKVYKTLERAPTPAAELMGGMPRVMAQGASAEEAAQMMAIMSEGAGHEEEVHVRGALRAIQKQIREGKGADLGQKDGMSKLEQVIAAAQAIKGRMAKGEKMVDVLASISEDERSQKGLGVFVTRGLEAGGFARTRGYMAEATPQTFPDVLSNYDKSDAGMAANRKARQALEEAASGAEDQAVLAALEEAKISLTHDKYFKQTHVVGNTFGKIAGVVTGVDNDQMAINEQALDQVRDRAKKLGINDLGDYEGTSGGGRSAMVRSQESVNAELKEWLKRIGQATGKGGERAAAGDLKRDMLRPRDGAGLEQVPRADRAKGAPAAPGDRGGRQIARQEAPRARDNAVVADELKGDVLKRIEENTRKNGPNVALMPKPPGRM